MSRIRRLAAAAGAITLASTFVTGPSSAQTGNAESYVGSAAGKALDLSVLSLPRVSLGVSTAKVTSLPTAVGEGAGSVGLVGTTQRAEVSNSGNVTQPEACALPLAVADILKLGLACGTASARIDGTNPVASGTGSVASIDLSGGNLLKTVAPITDPVTGVVETALTTVCGALSVTCPLTTTVGDVLNSVLATEVKTLSVAAGKSTSSVTTDAANVSAVANASGAEILLLPTPQVAGVTSTEPLATILVGSAKATAVYNRGTGVATPSVDPALVRVRLNTVLTNTLGIARDITLAPGQSLIVPGTQGTPLETEIVAAAGRTSTNPDGTVSAIADAVKIHALKGVSGGILLSLASAEAGVGGTPARQAPAPAAELPRTGGTPWVPFAGLGVLGLAVLVRRLIVQGN